MLRFEAEKAARQIMMSEYKHHKYEDELLYRSSLLQLERADFLNIINSAEVDFAFLAYEDILGPTRLRALRNSVICFVTPLCRMAIDSGVDAELSFALSDFYINYVERIEDEKEMVKLIKHIALHYYDLVQAREVQYYSKPISKAIRFIKRNIYSRCHVSEVSEYVGLERHYFSKLFSQQVGTAPGKYIILCKLEEGKRLLTHTDITVMEAAEALGFYDAAHFSHRFKEMYGYCPSHMNKQVNTRP